MKKFNNIIIVTDLDGTFLNDEERVAVRNREAVEYFKANGGHFTIATGRVSQHVFGAIPDVGTLANFPAVTCNGACLYDFKNGKIEEIHAMRHGDITEIVGFIRKNYPSAGIRASSPDYCFLTTPDDTNNPYILRDLERYRGQSNLTAPLEMWKCETVMKIVVRMDSDIISEAIMALKENFGDRFSVTQSWSTIIDIQLGGINKGVTLKKYIERTMGEGTLIYACGDYINDLEMLAAADVAVCPSTAHEKVKEVSDLCLCSHNDGLIADLVEFIDK